MTASALPSSVAAVLELLAERADRTAQPLPVPPGGRRYARRAVKIPGRHHADAGRHAAEGFERGDQRELVSRAITVPVIPGRAKREPGIHHHDREYGFRARAKRRAPE